MRLLRSTGFVVVVVIAMMFATASGTAHADEPVPMKARTLAERGRRAHDRGEYAKAIAAFKEAYVLAPSDALLFNLAQSYRLHGDCEDAAMMYKRFLASEPSADAAAIAGAHLASV
ncbi:MAG: hypothetical protein H0T79_21955, partial [Deltaproteobacteria bacterium]|nr:hypothetical protein [Deltaproteobacteria bacterium]